MINKRRIQFTINPIRLIRWLSGSKLPEELPISDTEPDPGLMGPGSVTRRLHREQWLILGGATCFLLQAAHFLKSLKERLITARCRGSLWPEFNGL